MADFSKDINVDLNTTPFDDVIFGSGAPLLEVELNEAQKLQSEKLERFFKNFTGNMICDQNFITIKNGSFAIDGYIIYDGKLLKMDNITISGATEGATIYIYTETKIVDKDTNITKNGYTDGEKIENTIVDDRICAETSKRTATFYKLAIGTSIKGTTIASIKSGKVQYTDDFLVGNFVTNIELDKKADKEKYGDTTVSVGRKSNSTVGNNSFAFGNNITASGIYSHAEGSYTVASGNYSHAEGSYTVASGNYSHAEGSGTVASGNCSHAEGYNTTASGSNSHAEGSGTTASGSSSHAEGSGTTASRSYSHAEGCNTTASGIYSHAEGSSTVASGNCSHAEGSGTVASGSSSHAEGRYNIEDSGGEYAHIVGNGTSDISRSNAHTVDWNGNAWYAGGMNIEGEDGLTLRDTIDNNGYPSRLYTKGRALILTAPYDADSPDTAENSPQSAGLELRSCIEGILPISQANGVTWRSPNLNLGDSSRPFGTIYCTHTSSDKKIKKDIENLSESDLADKYIEILDLINFVKFRWKHNMNGGMETPPSSRYHYGIIAQEIEKLLKDLGIGTYDNGIIKADFFAKNTSNAFITGGYREQFENEENGVTYDYSKNTYDFKKGNDYSVYNEILDKELSALNCCGGYNDRSNIGYLMIEDNSKLSEKYEDRPPVTIKGIILIDKEGNAKKLSIDFDKCISYYEWNDENLSNPKTSGTLNEDGSVTVSFNKKYSTYMIKVDDFNFFDYERIILDVDYVGEYKVYLIPNATEKHVNANVYDRDRVDDIMLTYHVDYQELQILCLHALQQKSKKQASEIADLRKEIEELKGMIKNV